MTTNSETLEQVFISDNGLPSASQSTTAIIDDLDNIELIQIPTTSISCGNMLEDPSIKNELIEPIQMKSSSMNMDNIRIVNEDANIQNLELIDCQIELMDQFNLTDHIELCNDEIQLQEDADYLRVENICDIPDLFNIYHNTIMVEDEIDATDKVPETSSSSKKRRKFSEKSKRHLKSNSNNDLYVNEIASNTELSEATESFSSWLDSIIETINKTMNYGGDGCPGPLIFRIPHVS